MLRYSHEVCKNKTNNISMCETLKNYNKIEKLKFAYFVLLISTWLQFREWVRSIEVLVVLYKNGKPIEIKKIYIY